MYKGVQAVLGAGVDEDTASREFAAWVRPHLPAMAALAARLAPHADRDDVVQDALFRAWRRRETYDEERGSPRVWLLAIVADRARRARTAASRIRLEDAARLSETDIHRDIDIERALRQLTRRQRLAVALHYFIDLSIADTARVMGCTTGTVKSTLYDARSRLGRLLEATDERR